MSFDPKRFLVLFAMVAALLVAGCGGDDEGGESGASEPLSEEDYATEIDDILTTFGEESIRLGAELTETTEPEELQAGVDELSGATQTVVDELNAIEPPESAAEGHEALTTALEDYVGSIETLSSDLDGASPEEAQQATLDFRTAAMEFEPALTDAVEMLEAAGIEPPVEEPAP